MINLTIHGIGEPARDLDPGEAKVWLSFDTFEAILDELIKFDIFRLSVDDSNYSDIKFILPALQKRNLTAIFFVTAGKLGQHGYLGREDVKTLVQKEMEIGTHGMYHRDWRKLDDAELSIEIHQSKSILEEITGQTIDKISCPFGSYDRRVLRELRNADFKKVYTSDEGQTQDKSWIQPRRSLNIDNNAQSLNEFIADSMSITNTFIKGLKKSIKRWR